MRIRLLLAASALTLAASPVLALTVQSAPPKPDLAQRLTPQEGSGPRLEDTYAGAGRPDLGGRFSRDDASRGATSFGFGPVRATVTNEPADPRWRDRRELYAPLPARR